MKKVALDIDDVLAGFYPTACESAGVKLQKCNIWDGDKVNGWLKDAMIAKKWDYDVSFWADMEVLSPPVDIQIDIECYITSSPKKLIQIRTDWLVDNKFPERKVYHSNNKLRTMRELGIDILIDDSPRTFKLINGDPGPEICIQFVPWYMTEVVDEWMAIRDLRDLEKWIKDLN